MDFTENLFSFLSYFATQGRSHSSPAAPEVLKMDIKSCQKVISPLSSRQNNPPDPNPHRGVRNPLALDIPVERSVRRTAAIPLPVTSRMLQYCNDPARHRPRADPASAATPSRRRDVRATCWCSRANRAVVPVIRISLVTVLNFRCVPIIDSG